MFASSWDDEVVLDHESRPRAVAFLVGFPAERADPHSKPLSVAVAPIMIVLGCVSTIGGRSTSTGVFG
ncbi:MAG: hypothetical protein ACRD1T_25600 [Acidimicrobiia bacterium]